MDGLSTGSGAANVCFAGSAGLFAGCASFSGVKTAVNATLPWGCAFAGRIDTDAPNDAIGFCAGSFDLDGAEDKGVTGTGVGATMVPSLAVVILSGSAARFFGAGASTVFFAATGAGDSSLINDCAGVGA